MKSTFTLLVCLLVLLSAHSQQAGTLDSSFAKKGWRYVDFVKGNNYSEAAQNLFQRKDGKYLLLVSTISGCKLVCYLPDGHIDKSFGNNGYADLQKYIWGAGQQADGKIVTLSRSLDTSSITYIDRYHPDGAHDNSFGGNGRVVDRIQDFTAIALALQKNGKIIVGGKLFEDNNEANCLFSSYNRDGSLNTLFGEKGRVKLKGVELISLDVQRDGKLVVLGETHPGSAFSIIRYNVNGSIDASFGNNGIVSADSEEERGYYNTVAVDDDGKIIIGGSINGYFKLNRYNTNGSIDRTFGEKGHAMATFGNSPASVYHLAIHENGKIAAAGVAGSHFALAQFKSDGFLDWSFGDNGKVVTILSDSPVKGDEQEPTSLLIDNNGKIMLAGFATNVSSYSSYFEDYVLIRYNLNGSLDKSFNGNGKIIGYYPASNSFIYAAFVQGDGNIIVAGGTSINKVNQKSVQTHTALSRYNEDGLLDSSFGKNGFATIDFPLQYDFFNAITIQNDGKIVAVGITYDFEDDWYSNYYIALARFNKDGSVDNSFGSNGQVIFKSSEVYESNKAYAIAVQKNGKILLVGTMSDMNDYFNLICLNANGTIDNGFGKRGKVNLPGIELYSIALQKDGKIVAAGRDNSSKYSLTIVRFNSNGSLDKSFGKKGKTVTPIKQNALEASSIAIQTDGKIVVGARSFHSGNNSDFALVRYNANGSLDKNFGRKGKITTDFGMDDKLNSIDLQDDGKIIATGYSIYRVGPPTYSSVTLARYNVNGLLDSTFGNNGKVIDDFTKTCKGYFGGIYNNRLFVAGGSSEDYFYRGILAAYNLGCTTQQTFFKDNDGDGYGDLNNKLLSCTAPLGYVPDSTDCNDNNASVHPGAKEICDNKIDDNCDGQIDEGCSSLPFLTMHNITVSEADGMADLTVSLSKKSDKPVYVFYFTADGTATGLPWKDDKDYEAKAGVLIIPAGSQSATVSVKIIKDNLKEGDEYFYVYLLGSFNATINDQKAKVTIKDETETSIQSPLIADALKIKKLSEAKLDVKAYPNPSAYSFMIEGRSNVNTTITVRIIDAAGRVVEVITNVTANTTINIGQNYLPGIYYAEVLQGKKKAVIKLIKQSK